MAALVEWDFDDGEPKWTCSVSTSNPLPVNAQQFRRQSSGEQAARFIRELIFEGHLAPGSHVPQDDIAQQLGMSRIPIREALIALERQGWVHIERHRGAFVHALDPTAVHDHYELYGLIYGFAARRAIERSDDGFSARLAGHVKRLTALTDDASAFGREAKAFHADVVDSARSPRIAVALRSLSSLVPGDFFVRVPGSIAVERKGLAAIARAVNRGDADAAAESYRKMMGPIGQLVAELFESRGLFVHVDDSGTSGNGSASGS